MTKIKICCIQSQKEAQLAIDHGAYALGLVSEMPSGPGAISESMIRNLVAHIPDYIMSVLLSSKTTSKELINQLIYTKANSLQIVDYVDPQVYKDIRSYDPKISLIQVIHVLGKDDIKRARDLEGKVDYILLDSGTPGASVKLLGGTGQTHDWKLSKEIVNTVDIPVFLAGGLNPSNIKTAINLVEPYGVDLCSGIRTKGFLSPDRLKDFVNVVNTIEK